MSTRTSFPRVLRSELIKARTLKSTWITVIATLLLTVGFGALSALVASGKVATQGGPQGFAQSPLSTVMSGASFAVLIIAVLGSLFGAREFSTGMIRTTFSAVPRRLPVLWAKLIAFIVFVAPAIVLGVLAAFFLGMRILAANGASTVAWGDEGVPRGVLGMAAYVVGLGVIGLALGLMLRHVAMSIGVVLGAVIFIPALLTALLPTGWDAVLKYLPSNAGTAFTGMSRGFGADLLSPAAGGIVFAGWIVLAILGAAWLLKRRDA